MRLAVISIIAVAILTIVDGFVLHKMWGWFVVQTFDLPPLSIPNAAGIASMVAAMTIQARPLAEKREDRVDVVINILSSNVVLTIVTFTMGYILSRFM